MYSCYIATDAAIFLLPVPPRCPDKARTAIIHSQRLFPIDNGRVGFVGASRRNRK